MPLKDAKGQRFLVSEGSREHPIYLFSSNSVRPINDADQRNPAKVAEEEHGRMALAYANSQGIKAIGPGSWT